MEPKVSCIIPAYNEEKTISRVVKTCLKTAEVNEVIVVNDGSRDGTKEKLEKFKNKIKIINLPKNKGKGYAVAQGAKGAKYPVLLFLDADLTKIKPHHLFSLINPIIRNKADMAIGSLPTFRRPNYPLWLFSGQRCLRKELIASHLKEISQSGYGLEVILNEIFKKKRIIVIPLISHKYLHIQKKYKQNDWLSCYIRETWEVTQKTIKIKSKSYRQKIKTQLIENLASYFRVSIQKIKTYLQEE